MGYKRDTNTDRYLHTNILSWVSGGHGIVKREHLFINLLNKQSEHSKELYKNRIQIGLLRI